MFGINWADFVIVIILAIFVIQGLRVGFLAQIFFIIGFFSALFFTGWLFPYIIQFQNPTIRTIVNVVAVLIASTTIGFICLNQGYKIHWSFKIGKLSDHQNYKLAESILGSLPSLIAGLLFVWLLGIMIGRLPFVGLSNSVSDSLIIRVLTDTLPPMPEVFAEFDNSINPNAQPYVPIVPKKQLSFDYNQSDVKEAALIAQSSVVRITSFSCGGIVSGSGFVVGDNLVATNAHVIAGSKRPIIKYDNRSLAGEPIYFDPNLDIAILLVKGLNAPSLNLALTNVNLNTSVAIIGYPDGDFNIQPGIIRDTEATSGTSIYNLGSFGRGVYIVQANIDFGSSGSPIVMSNGEVAGIIFSKSTNSTNTAYALTSVLLYNAVQKAEVDQKAVGTGACVLD